VEFIPIRRKSRKESITCAFLKLGSRIFARSEWNPIGPESVLIWNGAMGRLFQNGRGCRGGFED
jgi:hypothetical protein